MAADCADECGLRTRNGLLGLRSATARAGGAEVYTRTHRGEAAMDGAPVGAGLG